MRYDPKMRIPSPQPERLYGSFSEDVLAASMLSLAKKEGHRPIMPTPTQGECKDSPKYRQKSRANAERIRSQLTGDWQKLGAVYTAAGLCRKYGRAAMDVLASDGAVESKVYANTNFVRAKQ